MKTHAEYYQALRARDARFDGQFYVGVTSTGIYCRPVCPARTPLARSCRFFQTAAAAEQAGFRPCLRCRPELAPGPDGCSLEQALFAALRHGAVLGESVEALAGKAGFSPRHLRRRMVEAFGVTPVEIVQTERLLFAKKLLQESDLPMAEVAGHAGFGSLRRFNALFQARYRLSPAGLRRQAAGRGSGPGGEELTLRLAFRPPLAWRELLGFLAARAIPGVEEVSLEEGCYSRTVCLGGKTGWVRVRREPAGEALRATFPAALAEHSWLVLSRLRALFDLEAQPALIGETLARDPRLAPSVGRHPGLRVPGAWDGFELAVRAVLGQQVSVAGASTLAGRFAERFGEPLAGAGGSLTRTFPAAGTIAGCSAGALAEIGLPRARAATLQAMAAAVARGEWDFAPGTAQEEVCRRLQRTPGVGPWTAEYLAMRGFRFPQAFPAGDLGLRKALAGPGQPPISEKAARARAQAWQPWGAYAAMHLWQSGSHPTDAAFSPGL